MSNNASHDASHNDDLDSDFLAFPSPISSSSDSSSVTSSTSGSGSLSGSTNPGNSTKKNTKNTKKLDPHSPLPGLPPWLPSLPDPDTHPLTRLHNEIVEFSRLVTPTTKELDLRDGLVKEIDAIIQETFDGERGERDVKSGGREVCEKREVWAE